MKKVFLDDLPRWESGTNKGKINWNDSIGYRVKFIYDDTKSDLLITNYNNRNRKLEVVCNSKINYIQPSNLSDCKISKIIGIRDYKDYRYKIGDIIIVNNDSLEIINTYRKGKGKNTFKTYQYKCLTCNYIGNKTETQLKNLSGCPVCYGRICKTGFNDMWTTNPELAKLLANPKDGYKYMQSSSKRVNWKCPHCGEIIKNKLISNINKDGLSCNKCSDGISYGEKFVFEMLNQLTDDFKPQMIFDWAKNKKYDQYLFSKFAIIEIHGMQHYKEINNNWESLIKIQENDKLKKELALNNGIMEEKYIEIDARLSTMEYMKNSILNNKKLNELYDLSKIDWLECHKYACSSLIKTVCDLWSSGIHITLKIGGILDLHQSTVIRYLKQGSLLGFCEYNSKHSLSKSGLTSGGKNNKRTICINSQEIFDSQNVAAIKYNINSSTISRCCKGNLKYAGKHPDTGESLHWMYYEEWLELHNNETIEQI